MHSTDPLGASRRGRPARPPASDAPGVVEAGALYTAAEIMRRLQLTKSGFRALRRRGLPVTYLAGSMRPVVLVDDLIALARRLREESETHDQ